jgi:hypothetical protein
MIFHRDSLTKRMMDSLSTRDVYHILYTEKNEKSVLSTLNNFFSSLNSKKIHMYGLPHWRDFNMDSGICSAIEVNIPSVYYINDHNQAYRDFRIQYFQEYGSLPTNESIWGYELTDAIINNYEAVMFAPRYKSLNINLPFGEQIEAAVNSNGYLENHSNQIFRYQDYQFEPVKN